MTLSLILRSVSFKETARPWIYVLVTKQKQNSHSPQQSQSRVFKHGSLKSPLYSPLLPKQYHAEIHKINCNQLQTVPDFPETLVIPEHA